MRRAGVIGALLLAVLIAGLGLSSTRNPFADPALSAAAAARVSVPPGEYTVQEAIRLGLTNAADFERPRGVPICPPFGAGPSPAPRVRPGGTCWRSPDEQGVVFIVLPFGDPGFGSGPPGRSPAFR